MKHVVLFLLFAVLIGCQSKEAIDPERSRKTSVCNVSDPTEDLPWLKKLIDEAEKDPKSPYCITGSVTQGMYKGQAVFIPSIKPGPLCCMMACVGGTVYNCEGKIILSCNPEETAKITDKTVIWKLD